MGDIKVPDLSTWKQNKITISVGTILVLCAALFGLHQYTAYHLSNIFVPVTVAQELTEKVEQALEKSADNSDALLNYMIRKDLADARDQLQSLEGQLQETLLWETANNEENSISRARKADLNRRIREKEALVRCLEAERTNCDDL